MVRISDWSRLEITLTAFRRSIIPQKQFVIIIIVIINIIINKISLSASCYNLGQWIADKFTKLSKIVFSMVCFTNVKVCLLAGRLGTRHP